MNKHIPFQKLSKRQQRELNAQKRVTWGELNPVTRRPENSKVYNRAKAQSWKKNTTEPFLFAQMNKKSGSKLPPPLIIPGIRLHTARYRRRRSWLPAIPLHH